MVILIYWMDDMWRILKGIKCDVEWMICDRLGYLNVMGEWYLVNILMRWICVCDVELWKDNMWILYGYAGELWTLQMTYFQRLNGGHKIWTQLIFADTTIHQKYIYSWSYFRRLAMAAETRRVRFYFQWLPSGHWK